MKGPMCSVSKQIDSCFLVLNYSLLFLNVGYESYHGPKHTVLKLELTVSAFMCIILNRLFDSHSRSNTSNDMLMSKWLNLISLKSLEHVFHVEHVFF